MQIAVDKLNPESTVVLKRFGLAAPETMMDAAGQQVALVDFSDIGQAPANITSAEVVALLIIIKLVTLPPISRFCSVPSLWAVPVPFLTRCSRMLALLFLKM